MCTVLQQHLNQVNGYSDGHAEISLRQMAAPSIYARHVSPMRLPPQATYSYLQDTPNMKRPVDPYDRRAATPAMHFHVPPPELKQQRGRPSSYMQQLLGRRSRSHSRTGMRVLVEQIQSSTPRPRSPHMNNEEPINLSHYPDGRAPEENAGKVTPIERDDFPAPPYVYADSRRRRHWSEPGSSRRDSSTETTPVESSEDEAEEVVDEKLDKTETELKKISNGIGKVFLQEIALERERRKQSKSRLIDPRSAARTPTAKKEPHFRLRYDSPINASPSRVADHLRPWDDDVDGSLSRRSNVTTPFLPHATTPHPMRVVSPVNPIRPGYTQRAQTLPSRFSPGFDSSEQHHATDFSSNRSDDMSSSAEKHWGPPSRSVVNGHASPYENIRVSTTYTQGLQAATPRGGRQQQHTPQASQSDLNRSLPNMSSTSLPLQAPNIYPLHLLFTNNYRLPGDVDRCHLEKHLSDAEFDMVFRMEREEFYKLPYWKRCDLKRRYHLF